MAKPNPPGNRTPWYKSTAPTYAGIFLWFVFWQDAASGGGNTNEGLCLLPGGILSKGVGLALLGLIVAALLCHFLFYLVPGLLGLKTGLPLYVVGTSTYGVQGGLFMPGFLMGILQFGWLGVNAYFSSLLLSSAFGGSPVAQKIIAVLWAAGAAFVGLKGIQYVGKIATYLPLIPLAILLILFVKTVGTVGDFDPETSISAVTANNAKVVAEAAAKGETMELPYTEALGSLGVIAMLITYVVGFFATAGAAGVDFGMGNRHEKDVSMGGLVGIAGAAIVTGGLAILIVAGAYGAANGADATTLRATNLMAHIMGSERTGAVMWFLLAVAAFPPACFSSFIAANSFKTTLPKVNPSVSVGIGAAVSAVLAVTGWAGDVMSVFGIIGASFGPVCGAMAVDYLLAGQRWAGPRAGWNLAGWISWVAGFIVGMLPLVSSVKIPAAPLMAFIVGAGLYFILVKAGMESKVLEMAAAPAESAPQEAPAEKAQDEEKGE
jgi:cytosine permease